MTGDSDVHEIASFREDEYTYMILLHTSEGVMSVDELSEAYDASISTIYRRIERLQEHDLLTELLILDRDGYHHKPDTARLERIAIGLTDGAFEITVMYRPEDAVDRFTDLFEGV